MNTKEAKQGKEINMIAAVASNRAIGNKNQLLYWLPDDLKRFKRLTTGNTIIMGRRTYESLPHGPLPNRRNIVLSRRGLPEQEGLEVFPSLDAALDSCRADEHIYIIGGASLYKQALPLATRLCMTEIDDVPTEADAFFPPYRGEWTEVEREEHKKDERHQYDFAFVDYVRGNKS